jgi:hypothetical protein
MKLRIMEISVLYDDNDADEAKRFIHGIMEHSTTAEHKLGELGGVALVRVSDPEDVDAYLTEEGDDGVYECAPEGTLLN